MTTLKADGSSSPESKDDWDALTLRRRREQLELMKVRPQDFDFWHALRRLECLSADKPRFGTALAPRDESVRLGQEAAFDFAATNWTSVDLVLKGSDAARLRQRVFGLLGPNGPLPLHLTEFTRELLLGDQQEKKLGEDLRGFLDMLIQRPGMQFYRAWAQAQPVVGLDREGDDPFAAYIASLCGEAQLRDENIDGVPRSRRLYFSGWLGRVVRSVEGLGSWLSGGLGVPVRVAPFQPHWMPLEDSACTRIGEPVRVAPLQLHRMSLEANDRTRLTDVDNPPRRLGSDATLGSRVWDIQHKFQLAIGPLNATEYVEFLPPSRSLSSTGGKFRELRSMVRRYIGQEFDWDLRLSIFTTEIRRLVLGRRPEPSDSPGLTTRLGYGTWLGRPRGSSFVADLILEPERHVI